MSGKRLLTLVPWFSLFALGGDPPRPTPTEAARAMKPADGLSVSLVAAEPDIRQPIFVKCDDRGRVWTIQYLQYPNPAGLTRVKVDRWSRTIYDRIPEPPPKGPKGADRITICSDTDGDGKADKFHDFVSGLNLCTGVEFGADGVYVLQAPYLLYYPDRNHDDLPDGDPEVLLSGFGMEDAQSLANHLTWGPDGWLYGLNGSTTTCRIRGLEFQQGVWRYHPRTKEFELFCEGGGNVFGLTFDDLGNLFYSSNLGLFWHAHQGAYYLKNPGKHGPLHNPYAYGWLMHVEHDAPTGGPTTGGTIYRGNTFPERFRGRFLAGDFLRHTASSWDLTPKGATVTARFRELLLDSRDNWFGATDLALGPDGAIYLSDFHDKRTAHPDPDADWDRTNGRIYRIQASNAPPPPKVNIAALSTKELVELQRHPNGWYADRARVHLASRRDPTSWPGLTELARTATDPRLALRGLWGLHVSGGLTEEIARDLLKHRDDGVRAWTVRLLGDARQLTPAMAEELARLAQGDHSPKVQAQLLCSARRIPPAQAAPIITSLMKDDAIHADPLLGWLLWWAVETHSFALADRYLPLLLAPTNRVKPGMITLRHRLIRHYVAEGTEAGYRHALRIVQELTPKERLAAYPDLDRGLAERAVPLPDVGQGGLFESQAVPGKTKSPGKSFQPLPVEMLTYLGKEWAADPTSPLLSRLALRAGISACRERVHADLSQGSATLRKDRLKLLEELGDESSIPVVLPFLTGEDAELTGAALAVVARFSQPAIGKAILDAYPRYPASLQSRARQVLFSRPTWAKLFLDEVEAKRIAPTAVPLEQVRLLSLLETPVIDAIVKKHWGTIRPGTAEEKLAAMRRFQNDLNAGSGDATRGKLLFQKHCGVCHKLLGEGGSIGPELTNTSRADTAWLLASIVDPGAVIRPQYQQYAITTVDGVVRTGIIAQQDGASVILVDAKGELTRLTRDRIDALKELPTSLMPEQLLEGLSPGERRDLFRYLQKAGK